MFLHIVFTLQVHPAGLEPATDGLEDHCSSYWATGASFDY